MTAEGHRPAGRLRALDGIRGVAALVVVVAHLMTLALPYTLPAIDGPLSFISVTIQQALVASGFQAVYVFFLLSGIAITLPVLSAREYDWFSYFPRRIVRLYLPVAASLLFSLALIVLVPRDPGAVVQGGWLSLHNATSFDRGRFFTEVLLQQPQYLFNGPLWSLVWEFVFSFQLPLFVTVALLMRRWWVGGIAACIVVAAVGAYLVLPALQYLPMFLIGVLIAVKFNDIVAISARVRARRSGRASTAAAVIAAAVLLVWSSLLPFAITGAPHIVALMTASWLLGGTVVVLIGTTSPWAVRLLESRVPQWLGRISFSLYLVHFPILITLGFALGDRNWLLIDAIALPASLAVAWAFSRFIEGPSHRFSRWVGTRTSTIAASYFEKSVLPELGPLGSRKQGRE